MDKKLKEILILNAKDCLKYGYGKQYWNTCGIQNKKYLDKIWNEAKAKLIKEF